MHNPKLSNSGCDAATSGPSRQITLWLDTHYGTPGFRPELELTIDTGTFANRGVEERTFAITHGPTCKLNNA